MKPRRKNMGQYRKSKGLISLRTSKNQKSSNPMSKSLKLGTLVNLRKSGKGSEMTKASPTMHIKKTRTNNLNKMAKKSRGVRGLLSLHSEDEPLVISQEIKKKNDILRSEIIERQKKMGKHRVSNIRSVSMVVGDEDKKMIRKKMTSNANKKRLSNKTPPTTGRKDFIQKKMEFLKNNRTTKFQKQSSTKRNKVSYKTQHATMKNTNTLPRKAYTSNNRPNLMNLRKKSKTMRTMQATQKKSSQSRGAKRLSGSRKNGDSRKKYGNISKKGRNPVKQTPKENSKRSLNNIYKRNNSSKHKKQEKKISYQNGPQLKETLEKKKNEVEREKVNAERRLRKKGINQPENFENIYEIQKEKKISKLENLKN
jgi:hypothetical protein